MSGMTHKARTRGLNLIELLVVLVVIVAVAAYVWPRYIGGKASGPTRYSGPVTQARDTVCRSNLTQARTSIQALSASDPDGRPPQSITDLGLPTEMQRCPVGGEPYRYDPSTGRIQCSHPGHEGY